MNLIKKKIPIRAGKKYVTKCCIIKRTRAHGITTFLRLGKYICIISANIKTHNFLGQSEAKFIYSLLHEQRFFLFKQYSMQLEKKLCLEMYRKKEINKTIRSLISYSGNCFFPFRKNHQNRFLISKKGCIRVYLLNLFFYTKQKSLNIFKELFKYVKRLRLSKAV